MQLQDNKQKYYSLLGAIPLSAPSIRDLKKDLRKDIKDLNQRIKDTEERINNRISSLENGINGRISSLENVIRDSIHHAHYHPQPPQNTVTPQ